MATSESVAKLQSAVTDVTAHVKNMIDHLEAQLEVVNRLAGALGEQLAAEETQAAAETELATLNAPEPEAASVDERPTNEAGESLNKDGSVSKNQPEAPAV